MAEATINDDGRECPYCGYKYQPESEDYSEFDRVEECDECGKKYHAHDVFSVSHWAKPDCELNGEQHDWQPRRLTGGRTHPFCSKCDTCMPHKLLAEPPQAKEMVKNENSVP